MGMIKSLRNYLHYSMLEFVKREKALRKQQKAWRETNAHNGTLMMNSFNPQKVEVGRYSYGELNIVDFGETAKLKIGNFVSVAEEVTFVLDAEHHIDTISTFPFRVKILQKCQYEAFSKGDIIIDDDAWIGHGATVMSGVHVGQGAVIAAGAVVTKDVAPYTIVGGIPAKTIKNRFSPEIAEFLMTLDYGNLTEDMIRDHEETLYSPANNLTLDEIQSRYDWFPRKESKVR